MNKNNSVKALVSQVFSNSVNPRPARQAQKAQLSVAEQRRLEFLQKNQILEQYYNIVSPLEFLQSVFRNLDQEHCIVFGKKDNQKGSVERIILEDVLDYFQFDNVYIPYCSFFNHFPKNVLAKTLFAFCIDIDYVKPKWLESLIKYKINMQKIKPTYIFNSGQGVHLIYVLAEPVELYNSIKNKCDKVLKNLRKKFIIKGQNKKTKKIYQVDSLRLTQPYRVPGSLTKLGQVSTVYKVGDKVNIENLADWCKIKWCKMKMPKKIIEKKEKNKNNIDYMPNAKKYFYGHCLLRCYEEVEEGHRYLAMFALAVVAWKCRIPKHELEQDLYGLLEVWNDPDYPYQNFSHPVKPIEVQKALTGYNKKATMCPRERLEEWFGFQFRKNKRNYRTREEHLQIARAIRNAKISTSTKLKVEAYLKANPNASISEISRISGISRPTIYKYGKQLGLI